MLVIVVFIFGLFIGSFLLVIIDRFGSKRSFMKGRSSCDYCKHVLGPLDLIPIFSYISTTGKCRYCHKQLSISYPLFELLTGCSYALTISAVSSQYQVVSSVYFVSILFSLYIVSTLLLIFFIDLKYGIIPFSIVLSAIFITVLDQLLTSNHSLLTSVLAAIGSFGFFLLLFFLTILITKKEGLGFGDVVYVFFMGLLLGWPNIVVGMYIGFLSGAVISLILIALKKKKFRGSTIPFGPFLVLGTYIAWLWGSEITQLVIHFLFQI